MVILVTISKQDNLHVILHVILYVILYVILLVILHVILLVILHLICCGPVSAQIIDSSQSERRGSGFGGDVISRNYVAITLTKLYRFYTGCIRE